MSQTLTISIEPTELFKQLEEAQFQVDSRKELLGYLILSNSNTNEAFIAYENEYIQLYNLYQKLKAQFEKEIVRPICLEKNITIFTWNLDFYDQTLTITY